MFVNVPHISVWYKYRPQKVVVQDVFPKEGDHNTKKNWNIFYFCMILNSTIQVKLTKADFCCNLVTNSLNRVKSKYRRMSHGRFSFVKHSTSVCYSRLNVGLNVQLQNYSQENTLRAGNIKKIVNLSNLNVWMKMKTLKVTVFEPQRFFERGRMSVLFS